HGRDAGGRADDERAGGRAVEAHAGGPRQVGARQRYAGACRPASRAKRRYGGDRRRHDVLHAYGVGGGVAVGGGILGGVGGHAHGHGAVAGGCDLEAIRPAAAAGGAAGHGAVADTKATGAKVGDGLRKRNRERNGRAAGGAAGRGANGGRGRRGVYRDDKDSIGVRAVTLGVDVHRKRIVTVTLPVVAPMGTVAVRVVALTTLKVAAVPLKLTAVAPPRLVPVSVTLVPAVPLVGLRLVRVGAGAGIGVIVSEPLPAVEARL
nr:hypothetical protein [Tanacetum cinerariifolium]